MPVQQKEVTVATLIPALEGMLSTINVQVEMTTSVAFPSLIRNQSVKGKGGCVQTAVAAQEKC